MIVCLNADEMDKAGLPPSFAQYANGRGDAVTEQDKLRGAPSSTMTSPGTSTSCGEAVKKKLLFS